MRILVLSDSHGNVDNMRRCVEFVEPQHILHLGDCVRDAEALRRDYPQIPLTGVPGNCDWGDTDTPERLLELGGRRILMMHGHTRNVKYTLLCATLAARECGAEVLLFGHTHVPLVDFDGTLHTMNPGAAGERVHPGYGVITIAPDRLDCSVFRL